jgi:hypothetical protein
MPITFDGRLRDFDFTPYINVQANGVSSAGSVVPQGVPGRIERVLDPLGSGEYVAQFTLHENDAPTGGASSRRSEIRGPTQIAAGTEYWAMWSYLFPDEWADTRHGFTWFQWHDIPDAGDPSPGKPPHLLGVRFPSGVGQVRASNHPDDPSLVISEFPRNPLTHLWLPPGRWHTFVSRWILSYTEGVGEFELWHDARKVLSETNQINSYNDAQGPYSKIGLYNYYSRSGWGSVRLSVDLVIHRGGR